MTLLQLDEQMQLSLRNTYLALLINCICNFGPVPETSYIALIDLTVPGNLDIQQHFLRGILIPC